MLALLLFFVCANANPNTFENFKEHLTPITSPDTRDKMAIWRKPIHRYVSMPPFGNDLINPCHLSQM